MQAFQQLPNIVKRYLIGSVVYGGVHATYFGTVVTKDPNAGHRITAGNIMGSSIATMLVSPVLLPVLMIEGVDYVDKRFVLKLPMCDEIPPMPYAHTRFLDDLCHRIEKP